MRNLSPSLFLGLLFLAALVMLVAVEMSQDVIQDRNRVVMMDGARLTLRTPTATATAGWWLEIATWTPTSTIVPDVVSTATAEEAATPTPELDLTTPTRAQ